MSSFLPFLVMSKDKSCFPHVWFPSEPLPRASSPCTYSLFWLQGWGYMWHARISCLCNRKCWRYLSCWEMVTFLAGTAETSHTSCNSWSAASASTYSEMVPINHLPQLLPSVCSPPTLCAASQHSHPEHLCFRRCTLGTAKALMPLTAPVKSINECKEGRELHWSIWAAPVLCSCLWRHSVSREAQLSSSSHQKTAQKQILTCIDWYSKENSMKALKYRKKKKKPTIIQIFWIWTLMDWILVWVNFQKFFPFWCRHLID